ncbi:MAG: hypothetical protein ACTSQE_06885 [Candidatus Heimdallarchaeaceae archaeon]
MPKTEHNGYQDHRIDKVEQHIETLNHNSTAMRTDISKVQLDLAVVKEIIKRQDKMQWIILGSIIGIAVKIIFGA